MQRKPITLAGKQRLVDELEQLKSNDRPAITQAIAEARAHGDLKENAEYHAARERQNFVEARIRRIESTIHSAQVIDTKTLPRNNRVVFGVFVCLENEQNEPLKYQIVGEDESDVNQGRISIISPIARSLIGKTKGQQVGVQTPNGVVNYLIKDIQYD